MCIDIIDVMNTKGARKNKDPTRAVLAVVASWHGRNTLSVVTKPQVSCIALPRSHGSVYYHVIHEYQSPLSPWSRFDNLA